MWARVFLKKTVSQAMNVKQCAAALLGAIGALDVKRFNSAAKSKVRKVGS